MDLTKIHLTVISYSEFCINFFFLSQESRLAQWRAPGLTVRNPQIYFGVLSNVAHHLVQPNQSQFPSKKNGGPN